MVDLGAPRRVLARGGDQIVERAHQGLPGDVEALVAVAQVAIDDRADGGAEIGLRLFPFDVEEIHQAVEVVRIIAEPFLIIDDAQVVAGNIAEAIGEIVERAIFAGGRIEAVALVQGAGHLAGLPQAENKSRREIEVLENPQPHRQKPRRARVLEAEQALALQLFAEEILDPCLDGAHAGLRPPGRRQRKVMLRRVIAAVQQGENSSCSAMISQRSQ